MKALTTIEKLFSMTDDVWERHANPWSVWTRYSCLPFLILAIWSREWIGIYSLIPITIVILWTWLNPRAFQKPKTTDHWASKAVLGERIWLHHPKDQIPSHHHRAIKNINIVLCLGLMCLIWGLIYLKFWPTLLGTLITIIGKSWFLDRMVWLYQDLKDENELYQSWARPAERE